MKEQKQQHQRYKTRTTHQAHQDHNMSDSDFGFDGGQSDLEFSFDESSSSSDDEEVINAPPVDEDILVKAQIDDSLSYVVATDTIYIKTQVFRLLRYYSPAPRNIARSDWATQNITHNMTSSKT